jgi:hypothetical protein
MVSLRKLSMAQLHNLKMQFKGEEHYKIIGEINKRITDDNNKKKEIDDWIRKIKSVCRSI